MEQKQTPSFIPVIARLDHLDRQVQLLEEKRSSYDADFRENGCKTVSSALQEVQHKGTLMERLDVLEKRVLELSLEIDEANTSRSSSSTVQGPEMIDRRDSQIGIPKRNDGNGNAIQAQEKPSSCRSRSQKKKPPKKWPWLFRHAC